MTNDMRADIEAAIPHRDPFLFVDRIIELGEASIQCEWTVSGDAEFLRGHYPGQPVTPGVILSEHAFQCAAILISRSLGGFSERDGIPVLTRIENARFKRIVRPGETVSTKVTVTDRLGPAWYLRAVLQVGASPAAAKVLDIRFVLTASNAMKEAFA